MEYQTNEKVSEMQERGSKFRPLPGVVWKKHHVYELEKRTDDVAMYRQIDRKTNQVIGYEVFIVQRRKERTINGKVLPAVEVYPVDKDFGMTAYAPSTLAHAEVRYQQLIDRVNARNKG